MRALVRPRQSGKTVELLLWLKDHPDGWVLVYAEHERDRLVKLGADPNRLLTLSNVRNHLRGRQAHPFAVDNLELVLIDLLGVLPDIITMSSPLVLVDDLSVTTNWVRNKRSGKAMVHHHTCGMIKQMNNPMPWVWAEPFLTEATLKQALFDAGTHNANVFCRQCIAVHEDYAGSAGLPVPFDPSEAASRALLREGLSPSAYADLAASLALDDE